MLNTLEKKLGDSRRVYFYIGIIIFILYSNSLTAPFTLDDFRSITGNHAIWNPLDFAAIWNFYSNRFVLYFTLALDFSLHKFNVVGYHLVNIGIHVINGILVFMLLKLILGLRTFEDAVTGRYKNVIAFMGALLFVGHPVQVNAVTYIIQRTASLAAMFYLLSAYFFLRYRLYNKPRHFVLMLLSIVVAMFTKENTFSIPFMLLAVEIVLLREKERKTGWKEILMWILIFATLIIIPAAKAVQGGSISDPGNSYKASTDMSRTTYLLTEFNVMVTYLRLTILPVNQNLDYDYPLSHSFFQFPTWLSFILLAAMMAAAVILRRKNRLMSLGILWFFIGLSVESSLIAIKDVIFEHRLYLSIAGYVLFLAGLLAYLHQRAEWKNLQRLFTLLVILSIGCNFVLTYHRNQVFSNSITLWEDVVRKSPNKWRAHSSLGSNYLDVKDYDKAEKELKKALELNPDDTTAYINLSKLNLELGKYGEAAEFAEKSVEKRDKSGYGWYYTGLALYKQGKPDEAEASLKKALAQSGELSPAYELLGDINAEAGKYGIAVENYEKALKYTADDRELKGLREKIGAVKSGVPQGGH